ncbi:hypothetical protein V6N00_16885 [Tersicoccus sp. MR15.9]|uniref:hypothetical protein n=1 Tax=Tersicoccus mangrovi TaxID=3121635 RepID=UPI002FE5A500
MVQLTEQVFAWIAAGEFDRLGAVMHAVTADENPRIFLASAWRAIQFDLGALERLSASHVELPGGGRRLMNLPTFPAPSSE